MNHEKTFAAIKKLQVVEIEMHRLKMHRLKNALEMANKALEVKREWQGLTDKDLEELSNAKLGSYDLCLEVEAKLKEKNT